MAERHALHRIERARFDSLESGEIELTHDWMSAARPPLEGVGKGMRFRTLVRASANVYARRAGFCIDDRDRITFALDIQRLSELSLADKGLYVCGDFNGWSEGLNKPEWRLRTMQLDGWTCLGLTMPAAEFLVNGGARFKFASGEGHWFEVPWEAPNLDRDEAGNRNHRVTPHKTGRHLFKFTLTTPACLSNDNRIRWKDRPGAEHVHDVWPGEFFFAMKTDAPLGAIVEDKRTTFRLFAPRARTAEVAVFPEAGGVAKATWKPMRREEDGCWSREYEGNLHGFYYYYRLTGPKNAFSSFDPDFLIVDPWALALADTKGPGIIIDRQRYQPGNRPVFATPAWQDLVIAEAHVRDLVQLAPVTMGQIERRGFTGLRRWVEHRDFHLARLGVNAVELQPVQEFDNKTPEEYHWGYMTVNFFAPESSYAMDPANASQIDEFRELVDAFHRRGQAVILDVVYNHCGEPNNLHGIDKLLYFECSESGELSNWSGCGNDTRCASAMMRRLIIESCTHFLLFYNVDGFRFDLAELIGVPALRAIEHALKQIKPSVILISEPWSFRGHIAGALQPSGWASWNDGYRNFVREYVWGRGQREGLEYFLKGSPWYFARFPAQTVNYTESHDDRTWIDVITERADGNGFRPTVDDIMRSHLMFALLFMSIGIPMVSAGQDFLRSKHGVNNTYLRGDLNALDYKRLYRHASTHSYVAHWIRFRRSERFGRLLRLFSRPTDSYFHFRWGKDSAFAVVLNADGSLGRERILFAANPHGEDTTIELDPADAALNWQQRCDIERFLEADCMRPRLAVSQTLWIPGMQCALWTAEA